MSIQRIILTTTKLSKSIVTKKKKRGTTSYFNKTSAAIEIQMQVLNLSVFTKGILQIILLSFLVHAGHQNDPSFNG